MDALDGMHMIQAELAATKDLLQQALEANDIVGIKQMKHRMRELQDEMTAFMEAP